MRSPDCIVCDDEGCEFCPATAKEETMTEGMTIIKATVVLAVPRSDEETDRLGLSDLIEIAYDEGRAYIDRQSPQEWEVNDLIDLALAALVSAPVQEG